MEQNCAKIISLGDLVDRMYFVHPSTDILVGILTDTWPIYRSTYGPTLDQYVARHIDRHSTNMSTKMSSQAEPHTHRKEKETRVDFPIVITASGIACGHIRTTAMAASRKMAAILQIIGWQRQAALVYRILWYLTSMLWSIGHVRYINILTRLQGFRVKIANFSSFFCLSIPKRNLDTKKTTPNIEVWPKSLGAMLEYWYIERGLLTPVKTSSSL